YLHCVLCAMVLRTVKVSFGRGFGNNTTLPQDIRDAVVRHHVIRQRATWLLKLYLLENEAERAHLDEELVRFCLFVAAGGGIRRQARRNPGRVQALEKLFNERLASLLNDDERTIPRADLYNSLLYSATQLTTSYGNQIRCHFSRLLRRLRRLL